MKWHKIKDNYNRIVVNIIDFNIKRVPLKAIGTITRWVLIGLFVIVYSPFILIEYFSEKIDEEVGNINHYNFTRHNKRSTEDVIKKKLIRFGLICLSTGIVIGFIIGFII